MEWRNLLEVSKINDKSVIMYTGNKKYVATGDVSYNKIINFEEVRYEEKPSRANRIVEVGEIIFARMKGTNKVLKITEEMSNEYIFSTGFVTLKSKENLDINYLYYILTSGSFQSEKDKYSSGATQKAINNTNLKKIKIPVPSLEIQKQIVNILDKAQEIIDKRKEQIKLLDNLIESIFYHMFGDPVRNEKGFKKGTIRDLTDYTQYGTSKKASDEGKYPILRMGNITYEGNWNLEDLKYINLDEKEIKKFLVEKGDLLFNRTNSRELVGKSAVYKENNPMAFAGYLIKLKTNDLGNTEYISSYLNSKHGKLVLLNMAKSIVGMSNINAQELQDIKILIPPISLQNDFAEKVEVIEEQKKKLGESLELMEENYKSIMDKAFKGQFF